MSRFLEVYEPINEGWGMAIQKVGVLMGLGAFIANPVVQYLVQLLQLDLS